MSIERQYVEWHANRANNPAQAHQRVVEVAKSIISADADTTRWLAASLADEQRKNFTAAIFTEASAMPEALYGPMLRAAIYEVNPLRAQSFVEPCVKNFGAKRVIQSLLDIIEKGSNFEKAGAVNALHWATVEKKNGPVDGELVAAKDYARKVYLDTFLKNTDLDLRRSIITYIDLDTLTAGSHVTELIEKVIQIARKHPDEYIKHRVEVQLHRSPSAYSLPQRKRENMTDTSAPKKSWWSQLWK